MSFLYKMVNSCSALGCRNTFRRKNVMFFRFPHDRQRYRNRVKIGHSCWRCDARAERQMSPSSPDPSISKSLLTDSAATHTLRVCPTMCRKLILRRRTGRYACGQSVNVALCPFHSDPTIPRCAFHPLPPPLQRRKSCQRCQFKVRVRVRHRVSKSFYAFRQQYMAEASRFRSSVRPLYVR